MQFNAKRFTADFTAGKVFAYPTEAVYGLGCDPQNQQAMEEILRLKRRPVEKGVIIIAGELSQLTGYVDFQSLPEHALEEMNNTWPGPFTWLVPKAHKTPDWISGESELVAVRVSNHDLVKRLCASVNSPLVSTSANIGGQAPAKSAEEVLAYFGEEVVLIEGALGTQSKPSTIINALTMQKIR